MKHIVNRWFDNNGVEQTENKLFCLYSSVCDKHVVLDKNNQRRGSLTSHMLRDHPFRGVERKHCHEVMVFSNCLSRQWQLNFVPESRDKRKWGIVGRGCLTIMQ